MIAEDVARLRHLCEWLAERGLMMSCRKGHTGKIRLFVIVLSNGDVEIKGHGVSWTDAVREALVQWEAAQ